jgi:UDP:flavonoid glycosyltransferase YjiC (YdhE family)
LFWAHRLYKLGVSPLPIARGGLTAKKLVDVVRQTLDNPQFRERAIAISQKMQNEGGVAEAVQIFEQQLPVKAPVKAEDRRSPACS